MPATATRSAPRPALGWEPEGDAGRVGQRQHRQHGQDGGQLARGAGTVGPGLFGDGERAHHRRHRVLLVVHAGQAVVEPRPLDPTRLGVAGRLLRGDLLGRHDAGRARRPGAERAGEVVEAGIGLRHSPQPGDALTEAAQAGRDGVAAPQEGVQPAARALALPADLQPEDARLAQHQRHQRVGEGVGGVGIGPRRHDRQPVGGPVVGHVRHVVLAPVALGRQVGADAQRRLVPALVRELLVHERQRPEHLPGGERRVHVGDGVAARLAIREHRAAGFGLCEEEARQPVHLVVEVVLAGDLASEPEAGEVQRRRTGFQLPVAVVERRPVALVVEVLVGEGRGGGDRADGGGEPGARGLPQRAHGAGVVDDVVPAEVLARRGVVAEQPGAVGVLVAGEPTDRLVDPVGQRRGGGRWAEFGGRTGHPCDEQHRGPYDGDQGDPSGDPPRSSPVPRPRKLVAGCPPVASARGATRMPSGGGPRPRRRRR